MTLPRSNSTSAIPSPHSRDIASKPRRLISIVASRPITVTSRERRSASASSPRPAVSSPLSSAGSRCPVSRSFAAVSTAAASSRRPSHTSTSECSTRTVVAREATPDRLPGSTRASSASTFRSRSSSRSVPSQVSNSSSSLLSSTACASRSACSASAFLRSSARICWSTPLTVLGIPKAPASRSRSSVTWRASVPSWPVSSASCWRRSVAGRPAGPQIPGVTAILTWRTPVQISAAADIVAWVRLAARTPISSGGSASSQAANAPCAPDLTGSANPSASSVPADCSARELASKWSPAWR